MSDSSDELTSGQAENPRDRLSEVEEQLEHVQRGLSQLSDLEERVSQKHVELLNRFEESQANFEGSQGGIERPRLPTDEQSLRGFFATSFGSQGQSRWNADDQAFARLAFIFMVVHVAGGLVLTAFYYNFTAFEVYIMSLFWAMIVSIPLYQVKMTIIRVIFDRLLPDTFVVLQAHLSHVHHCKVLLRKLPRFYWLYMDQSAEKETESEESEQVSMVEAVVDRDVSEELQKGLAEGKLYHARVVAVPNQRKQRIEAYWEQRHWLGPFRPYGSIKEVFRDVPWLFHGAMSFLWFMLKPFHQFSNQADSAPYFGLLLRLCGLQLLYKLWTRELQLQLMSLAVITYIFVVFVRLAVWFVGFLAPLIWSKIPWSLRQALQKLQVLLKRKTTGWATNCSVSGGFSSTQVQQYETAVKQVNSICNSSTNPQMQMLYVEAQREVIENQSLQLLQQNFCDFGASPFASEMQQSFTNNVFILCKACEALSPRPTGCPWLELCACRDAMVQVATQDVHILCPQRNALVDTWHRWITAYTSCWLSNGAALQWNTLSNLGTLQAKLLSLR